MGCEKMGARMLASRQLLGPRTMASCSLGFMSRLIPTNFRTIQPGSWRPSSTLTRVGSVGVGVYRRIPGDAGHLSFPESELEDLLRKRAEARLTRDYETADQILNELRNRGVDVNDRSREWRAGAASDASGSDDDDGDDDEAGPSGVNVACTGPPELAAKLRGALLTQWRGNGQRRGDTFTHNFHPYKAAMMPLCAAQLLELMPPGDGAILDPFVGSGTSMVEALLAGRAAVGRDISPLAVGVARYQSWLPSAQSLEELTGVMRQVAEDLLEGCRDDDDNEFEQARDFVRGRLQASGCSEEVSGACWFLLSHEEVFAWPEWRKPRSLSWRLTRTTERYVAKVASLVTATPKQTPAADIRVGDARSLEGVAVAVAVAGVVSSPPYPGVYTYLDFVPAGNCLARHVSNTTPATSYARGEIGSKAEMQALDTASVSDSFADRWQLDTTAWLQAVRDKLIPHGRIAILIGDENGVNTLESISAAVASLSEDTSGLASSDYQLEVIASASLTSRTTRPWARQNRRGRGYRCEHTILMEKVVAEK